MTPPRYDYLPDRMQASARLWVEQAEPHPSGLGSFLRAVLSNRLAEAVAFGDDANRAAIVRWAAWLTSCPDECWGSPQRLEEWWRRHHGRSSADTRGET